MTESVHKLFALHPVLLPPTLITVQTIDHVVYLYGLVDTDFEMQLATTVAQQAAGATRVVNALGISGNR